MLQYVRPLSINKLQTRSEFRASLRASDDLVVLYDPMICDDDHSAALN